MKGKARAGSRSLRGRGRVRAATFLNSRLALSPTAAEPGRLRDGVAAARGERDAGGQARPALPPPTCRQGPSAARRYLLPAAALLRAVSDARHVPARRSGMNAAAAPRPAPRRRVPASRASRPPPLRPVRPRRRLPPVPAARSARSRASFFLPDRHTTPVSASPGLHRRPRPGQRARSCGREALPGSAPGSGGGSAPLAAGPEDSELLRLALRRGFAAKLRRSLGRSVVAADRVGEPSWCLSPGTESGGCLSPGTESGGCRSER